MTQEELYRSGGPAFASGNPTHGGDPGMALRDYFAGQALAGLLADLGTILEVMKVDGDKVFDWNAEAAYKYADAMLKARGGK